VDLDRTDEEGAVRSAKGSFLVASNVVKLYRSYFSQDDFALPFAPPSAVEYEGAY
jgi:hypothetical protein